MRQTVPTAVTKTENVEHVFCNMCGEEIEDPKKFNNNVEITLYLKDITRIFILCFNCIEKKIIPKLRYPPQDIDMSEG